MMQTNLPGDADTARVFFALWPDGNCAGRLHRLAERFAADLGGRAMRRETLHLTLAFVGDVKADRLPDLLDMAGEVAAEIRMSSSGAPASGGFALDRLACWKHNRILWAGSDRRIATLASLADRLAEKLEERGYALSGRPFFPHVTLVRKLEREPDPSALDALKSAPLAWPLRDFVMVRSRLSSLGPAYERLGSWKLADATY